MKKKTDYFKDFIFNNNIFICPLCKENLEFFKQAFRCKNNHTFDLSSKGTVNLIKTKNYKSSELYNKDLFLNRRSFILSNFYNDIYQKICDIIPKSENAYVMLDVGCGEASHSINILNKMRSPYLYYGFDYSSDAINMASDFLSDNRIFFKASVDNIPIKSNSVDIILDFLSPFNEKEFKRVLKNNGVIIKISPGKKYLKELRKELALNEYSKEEEVFLNIKNKFDIVKKDKYINEFKLSKEQLNYLVKMTPIKYGGEINLINRITIDMNIYVLKVKS